MSLGLLARVVSQSGFGAEITEFAEHLASCSQLSVQAMKDIAMAGERPRA